MRFLIFSQLFFLYGLFADSDQLNDAPHTEKPSFEAFSDIFKKISPNYLYKLYDDHPESHEFLDFQFSVQTVIHPRDYKDKKLVVFSLFWKRSTPDLGTIDINEETIKDPALCRKKMSFYDNYVRPMVKQIKAYAALEPETIVRIYLANDLSFLISTLVHENVEIYLMKSSSIGHSPGAMWRFLALNETEAKCVCIKDADSFIKSRHEDKINQWMDDKKTKGFYRFTKYKQNDDLTQAIYSPIIADNFGAKKFNGIMLEKAMKGFILHRQLYLDEPRHLRDISYHGHPYGFGNHFPVYGFDERFLKHIIYFFSAEKGELYTLVVHEDREQDFKKLLKSQKHQLLEKDYDLIFKFNKNPIYY